MGKRRYLATITAKNTRVCGYLKCTRKQEEDGIDSLKTLTAAKADELFTPDESESTLFEVPGKKGQRDLLEVLAKHAPQVAELIENSGDFCLVVWAEQMRVLEPINNTVH